MSKKLIFLTSFLLVLALVSTNVALGDVIDIRISAGSDDAEEAVNPGNQDTYNTSSDLEIPNDNDHNGGMQFIGLNFRDIAISSGMNIDSAYIEFVCDASKFGEGDVYLLIWGHLAPNPDGFANPTPTTISDRPRTQATVAWEPEQWTAAGQISQTVDISSIIQELIDQGGWAGGNAIEIIIGQDTSKRPFTGFRNAESFNGSADLAPLLHVEFSDAPAPLPDGWQSQDIGTTGGSAAESEGTWAISADGADIWGSADEFHYAYVPLSGDGTIIAQVISNGEGSNGWAKGGVMIRETLDVGSKHAIMALTGGEGGGIAFQGRPETDGSSWGLQGDITASLPQWVKLTREGNTITGYYSADGVEWALMTDTSPDGDMTDPIDIEMAADVYIGLFATSHAAGELRTYMFDNVSLVTLPQGWQSQDIDTTGGSAAESDGTWTISADGADIWGNSDQFHYVYRELTGDAIIEARVVDNGEGSNDWAKGGVMIRQSLDPGSINVSGFITGGSGDGGQFQWRSVQDDSSSSNRTLTGIAPPYYVRLVRVGNTFTVYMSADGVEWAQQGAPPAVIEMTDPVLIGLAVTSHQDGEVRTFTFDNVEQSIPVTDPNLLIYYNFESGEGTTVVDRSGHGNQSEFFGNPEWVEGIFGGAVSIDIATIDYIETAAPLNIVSNTVSVTGWVKHDESPAGWSGIFTTRGADAALGIDQNLGLQHDGTELRYMWGDDLYWSFSSGLPIPNGEWYFAAVTISPEQGKLYLNGVEQTATNVAPHDPVNFNSVIYVGADIGNSTGRIMTSLIDEVRFYNKTLTDVEILKVMGTISDVTAPGDIVQGVPNDGLMDGNNFGWPGAETPDLVTDNDIGTKFLHFKGELEPTGFQVTPAAGPTIVTGLTFTTANDAPERDPVTFELSGSNEGIDGPYELIASGDIVDFSDPNIAWPRFTMNATPISFYNDVAYAHYQVLFPALRDAASANSMQIAEVELLGVPAGPVGHWKLDEGEGTIAADSSGNGNDGILNGTAMFWMPDDGMIGGALSFDGTASAADYVEISTADISLAAGTVAMWGNLLPDPQAPDTRYFFGHTTIPPWNSRIQLYMDNADNVLDLGLGDSHSRHQDIMSLTTETWYHVALTWDGANYVVYVNGQEKANGSYTGLDTLNPVADIGNDGRSDDVGRTEVFNGLLDDVRIYDRALSADEIGQLAAPASGSL